MGVTPETKQPETKVPEENQVQQNNPQQTNTEEAATKKSNHKWLFISLVVIALLAFTLAGYFAYQNTKLKEENYRLTNAAPKQAPNFPIPTTKDINNVENNTNPTPPTPAQSQRPKEIFPLETFLSENCSNDSTINMSLLPFAINEQVLDKYKISTTVTCHWGSMVGKQIDGYVRLENRSGDFPTSTLKIGTVNSRDGYFGESDFSDFYDITPDLVVSGTTVVVDILQPGGYGLSSLGVLLEVRSYKQVGDFLVVSKEFRDIPAEGEVLDLMIKYADPGVDRFSSIEGAPKYTANARYTEFEEEFFDVYFSSYPNIRNDYKYMVDAVVQDVNSVSIK